MFAILTDLKGFHKVIPIEGGGHPLHTIRFAAPERGAMAPDPDPYASVKVNEHTFHYERQVTHDTFLYREWPNGT